MQRYIIVGVLQAGAFSRTDRSPKQDHQLRRIELKMNKKYHVVVRLLRLLLLGRRGSLGGGGSGLDGCGSGDGKRFGVGEVLLGLRKLMSAYEGHRAYMKPQTISGKENSTPSNGRSAFSV